MSLILHIEKLLNSLLPQSKFYGNWEFDYLKSVGRIACTNKLEISDCGINKLVTFTIQVGINDKFQLVVFENVKLTGGTQEEYHLARKYHLKNVLLDFFKSLSIDVTSLFLDCNNRLEERKTNGSLGIHSQSITNEDMLYEKYSTEISSTIRGYVNLGYKKAKPLIEKKANEIHYELLEFVARKNDFNGNKSLSPFEELLHYLRSKGTEYVSVYGPGSAVYDNNFDLINFFKVDVKAKVFLNQLLNGNSGNLVGNRRPHKNIRVIERTVNSYLKKTDGNLAELRFDKAQFRFVVV